ncbi:hypothetical protein G6F22_022001 [Rhizopus arrhizus]|nr:hypothetical protein G6F22_022001 [Rhizopus arrhizus]
MSITISAPGAEYWIAFCNRFVTARRNKAVSISALASRSPSMRTRMPASSSRNSKNSAVLPTSSASTAWIRPVAASP